MPKFTYPIVFVMNQDTGIYNGFIPDLNLFAQGELLEDVYAHAEDMIYAYFKFGLMEEDPDFPTPSTLEEISEKWKGYKVSLISADIKDKKKK